jgi:micrococcal nuclease
VRAAVAVAALAAGCAPSGGDRERVADDALRGRIPVSPSAEVGRVVRVVDGDTIDLAGLGASRLIGVDTPEVRGGAECFGAQASAFARRVLPRGSRVRYVPGVERHDRYGRALVYLWLADGRSLNAMLVEGGYARALTIAPNDRWAARFRAIERRARRRGRGRWSRVCARQADARVLPFALARQAAAGGRGENRPSRKVRTPKGGVVGNADPGKPAGKCHRKDTA